MNIVLITIIGEIENATIKQGDPAELKCKITDESDEITVFWIFGSVQFNCTETQVEGNGCYTSGSTNILYLSETKSLAVEKHRIECVIQQNLPYVFMRDASFEKGFNTVSKSGTITVEPGIKSAID